MARDLRHSLGAALALIATASLGAVSAGAWQATPEASPPVAQVTCPAPPVSPTALVEVLREPVPEDPAIDTPRGDAVPPAERATIGELAATWQQCLAAGDLPALLGLFTNDGINRLFGERSPYIGGPAGVTVAIRDVHDVIRLPDGRIAATVMVDPSGRGETAPEPILFVIEQGDDGVWRIDNARAEEGPVGAAGHLPSDPGAPPRALLRRPVAPGPNVPVPAPGPMVPMRGADVARTGIQTGVPPATEPEERWRTPTGWHSDAQPVASRGLIYFGGFSLGERTSLLAAVDARTGGVRWQTTAPVAWAEIPDSPAISGDILYAPIQAPVAGVLAVAPATGEALWFAPFGFTSVTAPAIDADALYVAGWGVRNSRDRATNDELGVVFALDPRTGREHWRFLAPARFGPLAVSGETVYIPSDHGLFALDRATGQKRWQARFSPQTGVVPVVARDTVVFAGEEVTSGKTGVFALDAASGALRWGKGLPISPGTRAGAAVANDAVYITTWEAPKDNLALGIPTIRAFALASGEQRWMRRIGSSARPVAIGAGTVTTPVIAGGNVLFGVSVRTPAPGAPVNVDGVYAVDTAKGAVLWHAAPTTPVRSAPAVYDGTVYAMGGRRARGGVSEGILIALGP
ncbi:MAG: PQQ-binding-like beta-propeller repeat protein [Thermomicrobiales bacterium]